MARLLHVNGTVFAKFRLCMCLIVVKMVTTFVCNNLQRLQKNPNWYVICLQRKSVEKAKKKQRKSVSLVTFVTFVTGF